MLQTGIPAPAFTLPDQDGTPRSLSDYLGHNVILYFYSKDMTSGCSKQACGFTSLSPQFTEQNAVILGVSRDSTESHRRFADKYSLPFTLLADPDRAVHSLYDVLKEKDGKLSTVRTTYLIDEAGVIRKALGNVKAADNPAQMLDLLKEA